MTDPDRTLDLSTALPRGSDARLPVLTLACHPDPSRIGERALLSDLDAAGRVALSRTAPSFVPPGRTERRPLADPYLSRSPSASLERAGDAVVIRRAREGVRLRLDGADLVDATRIGAPALAEGVVLEVGPRIALLLHDLGPSPGRPPRHGLVGENEAMIRVREEIERVADRDVRVLIRGETGTGKELVARALHEGSPRRDGPCVCVNMAAIPPDLAASTLFGHRRGAFSGAVRDHAGHFERADGGTLFLDEIGEASPEVQSMLLRTLETGTVRRVGGTGRRTVDVRLLAATDTDLEAAIEAERFKAPLLHRLSDYVIRLPPLRARRDDIPRLLVHFLREAVDPADAHHLDEPARGHPWLPPDVVATLVRADWPGNVRQLRNVARQMAITGTGRSHLSLEGSLASSLAERPPPPEEPDQPPDPSALDEDTLLEALRAHAFKRAPTARALGISRSHLYNLIERSERIPKTTDLSPAQIRAAADRHDDDLDAMARALQVSVRGLKLRMGELDLR